MHWRNLLSLTVVCESNGARESFALGMLQNSWQVGKKDSEPNLTNDVTFLVGLLNGSLISVGSSVRSPSEESSTSPVCF
jgi:hypothetical protein